MDFAAEIRALDSGAGRLTSHRQTESSAVRQGSPILYVAVEPSDLLAEARKLEPSITRHEYALARLVASEGYSGPAEERDRALVGIVQCAVTRAWRSWAGDVDRMLRYSGIPEVAGYFGQQTGRWAATSRDPSSRDLALVRLALRPDVDVTMTAGCTSFFDPSLMGGLQAGRRLVSAETILRRWHADGSVYVPIEGVDPWHTMFLRRARKGDNISDALASALAVLDGRGGGPTTAGTIGAGVAVLLFIAAIKIATWGVL